MSDEIYISQTVAVLIDGNNIEKSLTGVYKEKSAMINFDVLIPRLLQDRGLNRLIYFREGKNISSKLAKDYTRIITVQLTLVINLRIFLLLLRQLNWPRKLILLSFFLVTRIMLNWYAILSLKELELKFVLSKKQLLKSYQMKPTIFTRYKRKIALFIIRSLNDLRRLNQNNLVQKKK